MSGASLRVISPLLCIMMEREKIERERNWGIHRQSDRHRQILLCTQSNSWFLKLIKLINPPKNLGTPWALKSLEFSLTIRVLRKIKAGNTGHLLGFCIRSGPRLINDSTGLPASLESRQLSNNRLNHLDALILPLKHGSKRLITRNVFLYQCAHLT